MTLNEIDNPLSDTTVEDELIEKKSLNVEKTPVVKRESVVKSSDMSEIMQQEAVEVANEAMNKFRLEKDMATYIKEEFDKRHSPSWHCVVGRNFGSYVTHETNHFIYFYVQHIAIMLFKTGF